MTTLYAWGRQREGQGARPEEATDQTWPKAVSYMDVGLPELHWKQVSACGTRSLAISQDGTELWSWGKGPMGELGLAYLEQTSVMMQITKVPDGLSWSQVVCGRGHSLALTGDGDLYSWGANELGQLGHGHTKSVDRPTKVKTTTKFAAIAAGDSHSLAISEFGELLSWGGAYCGQLGQSEEARGGCEYISVPMKVLTADVTWKAVSAGGGSCAAITNRGELYMWGSGAHGRLGHGHTKDVEEPMKVQAVKDVNFLSVCIGSTHTIALTERGYVYCWGTGHHGELGNGSRRRKLVPTEVPFRDKLMAVAAGQGFSLALTNTGHLFSWGSCENGVLGNGKKVGDVVLPKKVESFVVFSHIAASDTHVLALGTGEAKPPEGWSVREELKEDEENDQSPEATMFRLARKQAADAPRREEEEKRKALAEAAAENKSKEGGEGNTVDKTEESAKDDKKEEITAE